ncbi:hypothetical protein NP493_2341g00035 [Ridgeia piscesae]|uniref:Uncharacterized protein n=1 Tax=Ridgeia piscesae TaxID=27915 RepID=A0AAD9N112_RIDPI|nr:hypothetical protein NP493_2341g00035 [Ridgeia piscesae]
MKKGRRKEEGGGKEAGRGVAAGSHYTHSGGGSNYLCLPRNPEWGKTTAGFQSGGSLYGAEYQTYDTNNPFPKVNGLSLIHNDVPCDQPSNETDDSGQTDLSGRLDERVFGVFDGATSHSDPDNLRLHGQRPGSHRRRSGQPKWRPFLQHRGGLWFTALS